MPVRSQGTYVPPPGRPEPSTGTRSPPTVEADEFERPSYPKGRLWFDDTQTTDGVNGSTTQSDGRLESPEWSDDDDDSDGSSAEGGVMLHDTVSKRGVDDGFVPRGPGGTGRLWQSGDDSPRSESPAVSDYDRAPVMSRAREGDSTASSAEKSLGGFTHASIEELFITDDLTKHGLSKTTVLRQTDDG